MALLFLCNFSERQVQEMALAGISSLGVTCGLGVETEAGTKPSKFNLMTRINAIGGISLETEQIDASALEDYLTRYIAGKLAKFVINALNLVCRL